MASADAGGPIDGVSFGVVWAWIVRGVVIAGLFVGWSSFEGKFATTESVGKLIQRVETTERQGTSFAQNLETRFQILDREIASRTADRFGKSEWLEGRERLRERINVVRDNQTKTEARVEKLNDRVRALERHCGRPVP